MQKSSDFLDSVKTRRRSRIANSKPIVRDQRPRRAAEIDILGLSFVDGRIALVVNFQFPDGFQQKMYMDTEFAHLLGCNLIEMVLVDRNAETQLRNNPGTLFDPASTVAEYAARLHHRMKLNDANTAAVWSTYLVQ